MKIRFKVSVQTKFGEDVFLSGSVPELGSSDENKAVKMNYIHDGLWEVNLELGESKGLEYQYFIRDQSARVFGEHQPTRRLEFGSSKNLLIHDQWRYESIAENNLLTSPFSKAFFKRGADDQQSKTDRKNQLKKGRIYFNMRVPRVGPNYQIGLLGNVEETGDWKEENVLLFDDQNYPDWRLNIPIPSNKNNFEYKYVIVQKETKKIFAWEQGHNRFLDLSNVSKEETIVQSDEYFSFPYSPWKAAGVAIPIFSIRTKEGAGVGEFPDIKKMVDWAVQTNLKVIQVLPVNDTVAMHNWIDSYPYAAISVHALHPIYASMKSIGDLKDKKAQKAIDLEASRLNELLELDYEAVMKLKSKFFKLNFDENKLNFLNSNELKVFIGNNESWVIAYAVFSYLRDKFKTPDFTQWGKYESMTDDELLAFASPDQPHYDDIAVHYYIQYHLDKQLKEATKYGRNNGVVLKGDIAIGIYRNSVDAWRWPQLFNMDCQTGAPPDDFSVSGQNWGFPTYNWPAMAADNYSWWISRMVKMSEYFDVFRIDHILGFFRIWEMGPEEVQGLLGRFSPSLSYSISDLNNCGIYLDTKRLCDPFIPGRLVEHVFGQNAAWVFENCLTELPHGMFELKEEFRTQKRVQIYLDNHINQFPEKKDFYDGLRQGLFRLPTEVLFLKSSDENDRYNPRISFHNTYSYQWLNDDQKYRLNELYNDYFYQRHNHFWSASAMEKLPMIREATDMLICGEDLGMVPACVPGVMSQLQILSLAVQRMPNDDREFWNPKDIPYMYVTTTGSHDVSNLREWWLEDREQSQRFYNDILNYSGAAPRDFESWMALDVVKQHLSSPAMLAIFPIQDVLAISDELKRENCLEERINIPANVPHYWKYRLHLSMEELLESDKFNKNVGRLVSVCGRATDY